MKFIVISSLILPALCANHAFVATVISNNPSPSAINAQPIPPATPIINKASDTQKSSEVNAAPIPQAFFALDSSHFMNRPTITSKDNTPNARMPMAPVADIETVMPMSWPTGK